MHLSPTSSHLPSLAIHWITTGYQFVRKRARCILQNCCSWPFIRSFVEVADSMSVTSLRVLRPNVWSRRRRYPTQFPQFALTHSNLIHRQRVSARRLKTRLRRNAFGCGRKFLLGQLGGGSGILGQFHSDMHPASVLDIQVPPKRRPEYLRTLGKTPRLHSPRRHQNEWFEPPSSTIGAKNEIKPWVKRRNPKLGADRGQRFSMP